METELELAPALKAVPAKQPTAACWLLQELFAVLAASLELTIPMSLADRQLFHRRFRPGYRSISASQTAAMKAVVEHFLLAVVHFGLPTVARLLLKHRDCN